MSTTKKGKLLNHEKPSLGKTKVTIWSVGGELGRLSVKYHMGHIRQVNLSELEKRDGHILPRHLCMPSHAIPLELRGNTDIKFEAFE